MRRAAVSIAANLPKDLADNQLDRKIFSFAEIAEVHFMSLHDHLITCLMKANYRSKFNEITFITEQ